MTLSELRTCAYAVGRPPTQDEIDTFATYSPQAYYRKFGGLFDVFDAAGIPYREYNRPANGTDYYGSKWWNIAERVRERDGMQCVVCGLPDREHCQEYGERTHVHHIDRSQEFGEPEEIDESELVTLCRPCHLKWERSPNDPQEWQGGTPDSTRA